jgi:hypothetical protein
MGCQVSAITDEDAEKEMDWFDYYSDHYLGYGSTFYYTGLHAPTFDYSDFTRNLIFQPFKHIQRNWDGHKYFKSAL